MLLLLFGAIAKLVLFPFAGRGQPVFDWLDTGASLALAAGLASILLRLLIRLQRRLLWRVRRKLILSYVFIGFVPVLLVVAFFAVAGAMSVLSTSSDRVRRELDAVTGDVEVAARAVGARLTGGMAPAAALDQMRTAMRQEYRGVSGLVLDAVGGGARAVAGPWSHGPRPDAVPAWIGPDGFAGLVTVGPDATLVIRVVDVVDRPDAGAVVIDLPLDEDVRARLEAATGVEIGPFEAAGPDDPLDATRFASVEGVAFLEPTDWSSGAVPSRNQDVAQDSEDDDRPAPVVLALRVPPAAFAEQLFGVAAATGEVSFQYVFLVLLAGIGGLFLVIEFAAFVMGLALARSITGSVHELFTGTNRVRRGDFSHRIRIQSGDQLGDLAESFNAMTASVEGLLHQAAEKKRLEEELRIARQIQMSLLPRDTASIPGLTVTALCRPAREVGGDYYDFIRLGERRLGLLVADVSGKGTSAALYMAELKGLILSLGHIYESPRRLLIETNRIMAGTLDSRSFITMLYAVIDLEAATLTYARAGHTPLFYASPDGDDDPLNVRVLAPDGLVLGLAGFERKFDELLEEHHLEVRPGDVAVLFTDGVTEAMNEETDLFGEERLKQVIEEHGRLPSDDLREQILRRVESFVGTADQHDDMTMVLIRVEETGRPDPARRAEAATVDAGT